MKMMEAMIAWDPHTDRIKVGPWPDYRGWSDDYHLTTGACYMIRHKMLVGKQQAMLFIDFNTIVVRDKVPVEAAHRAFLEIDEYRLLISRDMPGAEGDSDLTQMIAFFEEN
jgi:hypothetical protein